MSDDVVNVVWARRLAELALDASTEEPCVEHGCLMMISVLGLPQNVRLRMATVFFEFANTLKLMLPGSRWFAGWRLGTIMKELCYAVWATIGLTVLLVLFLNAFVPMTVTIDGKPHTWQLGHGK